MKKAIYIAGSYSNKKYIEELSNLLENRGFEITQKWWDSNIPEEPEDAIQWLDLKEVKDTFFANYRGVLDANIIIVVFNKRDNPSLQGALVELGIATTMISKKIIVGLGKPRHKSAMFYPINEFFEKEEELVRYLEEIRWI